LNNDWGCELLFTRTTCIRAAILGKGSGFL